MAKADLTTLANLQAYLNDGGTAPADTGGVLTRAISAASATILGHLQRAPLFNQTTTDVFSGRGNRAHFLRQWPVTSIVSVSVDGAAIPVSPDGIQDGYVLAAWDGSPPGNQQPIQLIGDGFCFTQGVANCTVVYQAGYLISREAHAVPAAGPYEVAVTAPYGPWSVDGGVSYAANGHALTPVASVPAVGQYALDPATPGGYLFAAADANAAVLIAYSFTPAVVEGAACELAAYRYKRRGRVGVNSQSLGGQASESYERSGLPAFVTQPLEPYRKVLPV